MNLSWQRNRIDRRGSLIAGRTAKMASPYIGATLCVALATVFDSLIAGNSIGSDALAAIAAAAPFIMITQIMHCIFGYGIDKLMIKSIGKGNRKEANRIFGAVIITVLVVLYIVFILVLLVERPILEIFIDDSNLIEMVVQYTTPILLTGPVFEMFLCMERAFRIDGRSKLFAARGIVTNILNILLDILLVSILKFDILGLAAATVISTLIGYTISLSHFFSKKRTVFVDISVILAPKEMFAYIKEDIRIGSSATLDEVLEDVLLSVQTGAISAIGGADGLAIWSVFKTVRDIAMSLSNGVSASVSVYSGLSFAQKDYNGVRYSVKFGTIEVLAISLVVDIIVFFLADYIAFAFNAPSSLIALCALCLRIGCIVYPAISFVNLIVDYLPAVNKIRLSNRIIIIQKLIAIATVIIGAFMALSGIIIGYAIATAIAAIITIVLIIRDKYWFVPKDDPRKILEYSISLTTDQIVNMKSDVERKLLDYSYSMDLSSKASLVMEETMGYILQYNLDKKTSSDIMMKQREDGVYIMIIDDGVAYNPLSSLVNADISEAGSFEAKIIMGLTSEVTYDRVLELNHLSFCVSPSLGNRREHKQLVTANE